MRTLVTGGVKSGKSWYALKCSGEMKGDKIFLATATAFDSEMEERIKRHQEERGAGFITIEEPINIDLHSVDNLLLDCVTMWMNNLFYYGREDEWEDILRSFLLNLGENIIIVTNEVGLGNIPPNPLTRRYNEYLAKANRMLAEAMDEVIFMVSGLPIFLKGKEE
jgi:adenosylcobinamide kinase/adenosylcobinamide-phosphate guanylyltransferase